MFEGITQPKRIKSIAIVLPVLWLVCLPVFEFFYPFEDAFFNIFPVFFLLIYLLIGFGLFIWLLTRLCEYGDKFYTAGLATLLIGILLAVNSLFFGFGLSISDYGRGFRDNRQFNRNLSTYEEIVAQTEKEKINNNDGNHNGVRYSVEVKPTVRIAFPLRGIIDNWEGIIYDPPGEVMKAKGFDKDDKFYAPEEITKLFGGDLVSCQHIQGKYYRCWFT